jgi:hypothetical protein
MLRRRSYSAQAIQLLLARAENESVAARSAAQILVRIFGWGHISQRY